MSTWPPDPLCPAGVRAFRRRLVLHIARRLDVNPFELLKRPDTNLSDGQKSESLTVPSPTSSTVISLGIDRCPRRGGESR